MLVRVRGRDDSFVAGLVYNEVTDRCVEAAPILHWCVGLTGDELRAEFTRLGYRAVVVPVPGQNKAKP